MVHIHGACSVQELSGLKGFSPYYISSVPRPLRNWNAPSKESAISIHTQQRIRQSQAGSQPQYSHDFLINASKLVMFNTLTIWLSKNKYENVTTLSKHWEVNVSVHL